MTRAIDRLIVSGAIDLDRAQDRDTPIGWVLDRLAAATEVEAAADARSSSSGVTPGSCSRVDRAAPGNAGGAARDASWPRRAQLALFDELPAGAGAARLPAARSSSRRAAAPLHRVRRLSYSALALFERCSYRYYAERVAGLREKRGGGGGGPGVEGLRATEIGDAVHRLLELVDLAAPARPGLASVREWYPAVTDDELERIAAFVGAYCESELAARIAPLVRASAGAAVRVRARRRAAARPARRALARRRACARPRLQDELAGRRHARRDRRGRLPPAAARLRARVLPGRGRRGRGRLPLPRAARRGRLDHVRAARAAGARGRAVGGDRAHRRAASSSRPRASSRAPAARRSTSSARARGSAEARWPPPAVAVAVNAA